MDSCVKSYEDFTERQLGERKEIKLWIDDSNYLHERSIPNLEDVELDNITLDHEHNIRIAQDADDI